MLMVGTITGVLMATVPQQRGGAWTTAKKYIEVGHIRRQGIGHSQAAVVGDTVGDPFKDTAGPSIHVLIKLLFDHPPGCWPRSSSEDSGRPGGRPVLFPLHRFREPVRRPQGGGPERPVEPAAGRLEPPPARGRSSVGDGRWRREPPA